MNRTNIEQTDIFISWTGKDRAIKDKIVDFLRRNGIICTESDHNCTGDFEEWSREAVAKSTIFLLIFTENTIGSKYVPQEIAALRDLENYQNRIVPVISEYSLYEKHLSELAKKESAIFLNDFKDNEEKLLSKILFNVQNLINNHFYKIYREVTKPAYLRIASLLKTLRVADKEFDYGKLYVNRTVTDDKGNEITDARTFIGAADIFFLQGPGGSGKSSYIEQLRSAADEKTFVISLSCRKLIGKTDLMSAMFDEFRRHFGNRYFYTMADFRSLLSVRHLQLVLDGMDEIATYEGKRAVLNMVSDYYAANNQATTLFFTGRNEEDADLIAMNGQTPKILRLRSFVDDEIKLFGENLFLLLGSPDKNEEFYVRIQDLSDEIRTNPLLLSQLMIVYDKKEKIPETIVEIYDAVCEITLYNENEITDIDDNYRNMLTKEKLPKILKSFSVERYRLKAHGKEKSAEKIFSVILKNKYAYEDAHERAAFLTDYLKNRTIMKSDDDFYHKMLLEYFTAVYYYDNCFNDYDELEDEETLRELFSHYSDSFWSSVLKLFLIKADSQISSEETEKLYKALSETGITEYTLLFDTVKDLINQKKEATAEILSDILQKSSDGTYLPYGPLFWYIPEYFLYEELICALSKMTDEENYTKALALTRDVCWIFGHYNCISEITDKYDGNALFGKAQISGVRKGLCELFFTGQTDATGGQDIYPRCFNIREAKYRSETGCGIHGRMKTAFEDELKLYSHESFTRLGGEFIGIVSAKYDIDLIETTLGKQSCKKLCGLFLSPAKSMLMKKLAINDKHIKEMYLPETILDFENNYKKTNCVIIDNGIVYFNEKIVVPDTTEKIEKEVFGNLKNVRSVVLHNNIKEIGEKAFSGCSALEDIILPDSITEIGERAFYYCTSLSSINIPANITEIKEGTFMGCQALKKIKLHNNIKMLGEGAFAFCYALPEIDLPDNLITIEQYAFANCFSLESIDIPDNITRIKSGTFEDCSSLKKISFPLNLKIIEECAFKNCTELPSIDIPDGTRTISDMAFENCKALTSIQFPDSMQYFGNNIFRGCIFLQKIENCPKGYNCASLGISHKCSVRYSEKELQTLIIPDGSEEIEYCRFEGDCSFDTVNFPESIKKIGFKAFKDCYALRSIILPDSITDIESGAFEGCKSLSYIKISDEITKIAAFTFADCTALEKIEFPEKLRQIGFLAFKNCTSLKSIRFPDSIKSLGNDIFLGCSKLKKIENCPVGYTYDDLGVASDCQIYYRTEILQPLVIPDAITEISERQFCGIRNIDRIQFTENIMRIGDFAFMNCNSLSTVRLPDSIKSLGNDIFHGCSKLKKIENCPVGYAYDDFGVASDCQICYREDVLQPVVIPEDVKEISDKQFMGYRNADKVYIHNNITKIGNEAFKLCRSLVSITLSDSVISIGHNAFEDCSSLPEVSLPDSVTEIGRSAFKNCTSLETVRLSEKIRFIGNSTFRNCSSLTAIKLSEEITGIDMFAFAGCKNLPEITLPEKLLIVGSYTFADCKSLKTLKFSDSIEKICKYAFSRCRSLTSVKLSENLKEIAESAFEHCDSLPQISIPNSVRTIGNNAFEGCTGLREISISRRFEEDLQRIFADVDLSEVKISWI